MKKIPTLFHRDPATHLAYDEVNAGTEWVVAGEGTATRKFDGTACLVRDEKLFKRFDAKGGKTPPQGFEPCEGTRDPVTGHWPGWVPVGDGPDDKWHWEALRNPISLPPGQKEPPLPDGTYELVGPKVQGNHEGFPCHVLVRHGIIKLYNISRTFDAIKEFLSGEWIEGIVWHHPDGRMAKIKRKDFGLPWPVQSEELKQRLALIRDLRDLREGKK